MVDYKKWDKFAADVSDDEAERDTMPLVTKFDKEGGETIEIGKNGYSVHTSDSKSTHVEAKPSSLVTNSKKEADSSEMDILNGGYCGDYYWSQDRYEVKVLVPLHDNSIRGKDLIVHVGGKFLKVLGVKNSILFEKELQFDIEKTAHEESASGIDWEIITRKKQGDSTSNRYLQLLMKKKCPIPGAFFWWKNVFVGDPEIDVTKIAGRTTCASNNNTVDAWKDAHDKFAAGVAKREKIEVDF